jgi:hypothetical protein
MRIIVDREDGPDVLELFEPVLDVLPEVLSDVLPEFLLLVWPLLVVSCEAATPMNGFAEEPPVAVCKLRVSVPYWLCCCRLALISFDCIACPFRFAHIQLEVVLVKSIVPPVHELQFEPGNCQYASTK